MNLITLADYAGIYVFAISGGLVAIRHNMDLFGILVISLLPAIGGGTLRDTLLDVPVFWLKEPWVIGIALAGGISTILYNSWNKVKFLVWADALGLSLFAVLGTAKTYELGYGFITCVMMGTVTATGGGLIRDVVCGGPPLLLKEDIYAMAALAGSSLCYLALYYGVNTTIALSTGFLIVFLIRGMAIHFKPKLPSAEQIQRRIYRRK